MRSFPSGGPQAEGEESQWSRPEALYRDDRDSSPSRLRRSARNDNRACLRRYARNDAYHHNRHTALADHLARHLVPLDGVEVPIAEPSAPPDTGARLATALLAYMALITAVVTLLPFQFAFPTQPRVVIAGGFVDVLAN